MKKYRVTFVKTQSKWSKPMETIEQIYVTPKNSDELLIIPETGYSILTIAEIRSKPIILT